MEDTNEEAEADLLLERAYHLAQGDTHRAVDLQHAGQELGLSTKQVMLLLGKLVTKGCLLPVEEPGRMALYLTPKAVKQMASVQTRR